MSAKRASKAKIAVPIETVQAAAMARVAEVATLLRTGTDPSAIYPRLTTRNPVTGKPYSKATVKADLRRIAQANPHRVAEIIGRVTYTKPMWPARILLSKDTTWPDYVFWDNLRRGKAAGYEIGGLFCTPIAQTIASYVFGGGISAALSPGLSAETATSVHEDGKPTRNLKTAVTKPAKPTAVTGSPIDYTNVQLGAMLEREQGFLVNTVVDSYCLAEQYVFVNPDCTFSVASPETVNVEYSASDYRRMEKVIVTTKYVGSLVTDTYTAETRTVLIHYLDGRKDVAETYDNLIGRNPMIHLATDRAPNEIHGRPIYEASLPIMQRYDDLMYKTTAGVEMLGNPMPAFVGLDNPGETLGLIATQQPYIDENGNPQVRYLLRLDRDAALVIGKGGDVKMVAPPVGFTKDSLDVINQLFLLLLNHTRIPQYVWGGAIASSKASTETQAPPFAKYIKFRRLLLEGIGADTALGLEARGGLLELIDIWLRMYRLLNPNIVVGPVQIEWPDIDEGDALIKQTYVTYFNAAGKMTDEDAFRVAGLFDDPAAAVARAQGKPQRHPNYDEYEAGLRKARLKAAQASTEPDNDKGAGFSMDYDYPNPAGNGHGALIGAVATRDWTITGPQTWQDEIAGSGGQ